VKEGSATRRSSPGRPPGRPTPRPRPTNDHRERRRTDTRHPGHRLPRSETGSRYGDRDGGRARAESNRTGRSHRVVPAAGRSQRASRRTSGPLRTEPARRRARGLQSDAARARPRSARPGRSRSRPEPQSTPPRRVARRSSSGDVLRWACRTRTSREPAGAWASWANAAAGVPTQQYHSCENAKNVLLGSVEGVSVLHEDGPSARRREERTAAIPVQAVTLVDHHPQVRPLTHVEAQSRVRAQALRHAAVLHERGYGPARIERSQDAEPQEVRGEFVPRPGKRSRFSSYSPPSSRWGETYHVGVIRGATRQPSK
jgi:hypothetical protein